MLYSILIEIIYRESKPRWDYFPKCNNMALFHSSLGNAFMYLKVILKNFKINLKEFNGACKYRKVISIKKWVRNQVNNDRFIFFVPLGIVCHISHGEIMLKESDVVARIEVHFYSLILKNRIFQQKLLLGFYSFAF